ncbi:MAG TPA: hypothetical protein VNO30_40960 [Kofleriaceae bacterium]|nr:hypothetical protein [Kofleriaceae bacterium]
MGQSGGFSSKPGARSLVQAQAEHASTGTPGKRTLVEQLGPPRAGGVASTTVVAHAPARAAPEAGPDRTTVGVGETVLFTAQGDGAWEATAGTPIGEGPQFAWTAPATPRIATVTFHPDTGAPIPTQMTVIAPSAVRMTKVADDALGTGEAGAGMTAKVTLHPLTVSFAATQWREDSGQPGTAATGHFAGKPLPVHEANPSWLDVDDGNTGPVDHAAFSGVARPWTQGSFEWAIPTATSCAPSPVPDIGSIRPGRSSTSRGRRTRAARW